MVLDIIDQYIGAIVLQKEGENMNEGKKFEQDFKNSVPSNWFYYRFKDGSASWGGNDKVRFQANNICDCMIFNSTYLYLVELKSHKGKSIPLNCIRDNQKVQMKDASNKGCVSLFIFNMRDIDRTYIVYADDLVDYIENTDRKSIPLEFLIEKGQELIGNKKRTRWIYDIEKAFIDII